MSDLVRKFCFFSVMVLGAVAPWANAAPDPDRMQAALVYNIAKFTRWPEAQMKDATQMRLCLIGTSAMEQHLRAVDGKSVQGRVLQVHQASTIDGLCHIVVFAEDESFQPVEGALTIGHGDAFLDAGGMIALDVERNRMVFDVNLSAFEAKQFSISAEALNLARAIR